MGVLRSKSGKCQFTCQGIVMVMELVRGCSRKWDPRKCETRWTEENAGKRLIIVASASADLVPCRKSLSAKRNRLCSHLFCVPSKRVPWRLCSRRNIFNLCLLGCFLLFGTKVVYPSVLSSLSAHLFNAALPAHAKCGAKSRVGQHAGLCRSSRARSLIPELASPRESP